MVQGYLSPDVRQVRGVGCVLDGGLRGHQLNKPVKAREAVGEHLGKIGQLSHRTDERGDIQAEGNQVDIVQPVLHNEPAACGNDRHGQQADEQLHAGVEKAHLLMEVALGGLEHLVGPVEAALLLCLVGEGLGGADAGEAGLDLGIDGAGLLLGGPGRLGHLAAAVHNHQQEHGDDAAHHQGQPPLDGEHHRQSADDGDQGDEQVLRPVVGQLRQLEQVRGQAAHQLAGAVFIVKVEAQVLHMGKQVPADIGLHQDAEGVAPVAHDEVKPRPEDKGRHHQGHDREENGELLLRQPVVHGGAGDQGKGQVDDGNEEGAGDIQQEQAPVGAEVGQENAQRSAGTVVLGGHDFSLSWVKIRIVIQCVVLYSITHLISWRKAFFSGITSYSDIRKLPPSDANAPEGGSPILLSLWDSGFTTPGSCRWSYRKRGPRCRRRSC